jgi:hypothetical protein
MYFLIGEMLDSALTILMEERRGAGSLRGYRGAAALARCVCSWPARGRSPDTLNYPT